MDISKRLAEKKDSKEKKKNKTEEKLNKKIKAANLKPSCINIYKNDSFDELDISPTFWKTVLSITLMRTSMVFPLIIIFIVGLIIFSVKLILTMNLLNAALLVLVYGVLLLAFYLFVKLKYSSLRIRITKDGEFAIWTWRKNPEKPNYIGTKKNMDVEIRDRYYNFYKQDQWGFFL